MTLTAYGYTIFCDDIRHEIGNKTSYVGVYRSILYGQDKLPFVIPKLGIVATYRQPADWERLPMSLSVFLPGDGDSASIQSSFPAENEPTWPRHPPSPDGERYLEYAAYLLLSPLVIQEFGHIRVRAYRGEEMFRLGCLSIEPQRRSDAISASQPPSEQSQTAIS
jgi:hypothetical protein